MTCSCKGKNASPTPSIKSDIDLGKIEDIVNEYQGVDGNLITVLQKAQDSYGYLPLPVLEHISDRLGIKKAKIYGVATFYAQFRLAPIGKHLILLCQGTACHVNGAGKIETALCDELKVEMGGTTEDGLFTLNEAACLGCCSLAPVMMIDGVAYGPLTPDKARNVIKAIYQQEESSRKEVGA